MIRFENVKPLKIKVVDKATPALNRSSHKLAQAKTALARATTIPKPPKPAPAKDAPKRKGKPTMANGFTKKLTPSPALAAVIGPDPVQRTEVVSKLWDYIRTHNRQNPENKREILADDKLRPVFGADKVTMFQINKVISAHLTPA